MSIIIPCYNQAHYLKECLISLRRQTYEHWEAIVVDDASTEGDPTEVVAQLADDRCRVIKHAVNRGLGATRNTGCRAARFELVLPLDADDLLEPTFLEVTVTALQEHPDIDCVFPDFQLFGTSDGIARLRVGNPREMLRGEWRIPGAGVLMRKQVWASVGGYAEVDLLRNGKEDTDFWLSAVECGLRPMHIALPLYWYRRHAGSMGPTSTRPREHALRDAIYYRHRELFDRYGQGSRYRSEGYLINSYTLWMERKYGQSIVLGLRGLLMCPWNPRVFRHAVRILWRRHLVPRRRAGGAAG